MQYADNKCGNGSGHRYGIRFEAGEATMTVLGMPTAFVALVGLSVLMSIALPIWFAVKFDWDPSEVHVDVEESGATTGESAERVEP